MVRYLGDMSWPTMLAPRPAPWESPPMEDAELEKIARDYVRAEAKAAELRPRLYAGIFEYREIHGDRRGWQAELVQKTGLSRERIRQIVAAEEKRRETVQ